MIKYDRALSKKVSKYYQETGGDPPFVDILKHLEISDDDLLADAIEVDGRLRLHLNKEVGLHRYLEAIDDLQLRPDPLDAAIDMALRSIARTGHVDNSSIARLVEDYPQFERPIQEAAALNNALWSTTRLQSHLLFAEARELPCAFGQFQEDGQRRYELQELLGEGAFGQVYVAIDSQLSETDHAALVSIKILAGRDRSDWSRRQLIEEATKARRINHPNVARVLDRDVSDQDEDFIVYEFVDGGDLSHWYRRQPRPLEIDQVVDLVKQIARGVHAAHMAGLVHCDIKPGNIVMTSTDVPKVVDFGIAIRAGESESPERREANGDEPLGNLAFMSPEQFRQDPGSLTIPTDTYALGGILFWLATGELPNGSTQQEIRDNHDSDRGRKRPPLLSALIPPIDRDLQAICSRAMALRPEDRHNSVASFADDLELWLKRMPIHWTRPSPLRRMALWRHRKPGLFASLCFVLALLIASAIGLEHFASVARQKKFEAAIADAQAEVYEQAMLEAGSQIIDYMTGLTSPEYASSTRNEVLMSLWVTECLYGAVVLDEREEQFKFWNKRIELLRSYLSETRKIRPKSSLEILLWETSLGFWLVKTGDDLEAEPLLDENVRNWEALLRVGDPWIEHVRAIRDGAHVNRLVRLHGKTGSDALADQEARDLFNRLHGTQQSLAETDYDTPVHRLVVESLLKLCGPELLDDEIEFEKTQKLWEALNPAEEDTADPPASD